MSQLPSFDHLKAMAEKKPQHLEALLNSEVRKIIDSTEGPAKKRLEGLQFQIDAQRRLAKNPMDALLRIYSMMQDSVVELQKNLTVCQSRLANFDQSTLANPFIPQEPASSKAGILHFPRSN